MDTFFLRAKTEALITPSQGVSVSNYFYQTHTLSPVNSSALSYTVNAEFNLYRLQYDKFRVNSVHVRVVPKANFLSQFEAQDDAIATLTGDGMWHTVVDRDSNGVSNIAALSRYPSYRKFDQKKPWSRSYSVKYPTGVWIDCDSPASFEMDKALGLQGGITMYAENFLEDKGEIFNEPVASIEVYYNIVFQGKTSSSIQAVTDESGKITGITLVSQDTYTPLPLTSFSNVRGTLLKDTRSSQTVDTDAEIIETAVTDQAGA